MTGQAQNLFSSKLDNKFVGQPTDAPVMAVRDVLICGVDDSVPTDSEEVRAHPPVASRSLARRKSPDAGPFDLGRGLRIDLLSREETDLVITACSPRGHHFFPLNPFRQRYSYVRTVDLTDYEADHYRWDSQDVIWDALALSRLVRDNGHSTAYAARIVDYEDGEQQVIYTLRRDSDAAYRVRRSRDWLDPSEAQQLAQLLVAYWEARDDYPTRLSRAMWRAEYATSIKWADVILPTLISGLEALVKVGRGRLTVQFAKRASQLAAELDLDQIDEGFCTRMYDARSDWVHGSRVALSSGQAETPEPSEEGWATLGEVARLQDLLRAAVRRAVEDSEFRDVFRDDATIQDRWPV